MRVLSSRLRPKYAFWLAASAVLIVPAGLATPSAVASQASQATQVAAQWNAQSAGQLIEAIEASQAEGLHPADYGLAALRRAAAVGEGPELDALANTSALQLAHDYYFGRVGDRSDMQWMIQR